MPSDWVSVLQASGSDSFGRYCSRAAGPPPPPSGELPLLPLIISCSPTASVFDIVNSDRSSYSDVVLLNIRSGSNFFRCSLSPWMQLMLQVSLEVAKTVSMQLMSQDAEWMSNVQIFKCSNVPMFQSSNVQMFKCSNVSMFQCPMVRCSNVPMFQWSNVPLF